ncbi:MULTISPECIES: hypothetical protein [unclassified Rhodococcus (in: high G+C Gram-positive bacteria)]|uniref:hypothetical protein n=1 Tax=unclassified Rhodococcus (in: high G+C Gram-positive bacteria) TaxID=192944 RepID=UPI0027E12D80|nr:MULTISPECIES: hypothetical protein [unclassified Rhodococcus (in: high G+C Gram-positive bacteria)]
MGQPFAGSDSNCTTSSATPHRSGRPVLPDLQHFRDYVLALGYLAAPVVVAGPDTHWSGHRVTRIEQLVAAAA